MSQTWLLLLGAAFGGGGLVQAVAVIVKTRSEQRKLHSESRLNYSSVTDKLISQLQADGDNYRAIVKELQAEVERMRARQEEQQRDFNERLGDAQTELVRLRTRITQLGSDLDIALRQNEELRGELRRHRGGD